jgi:hypothetical protein
VLPRALLGDPRTSVKLSVHKGRCTARHRFVLKSVTLVATGRVATADQDSRSAGPAVVTSVSRMATNADPRERSARRQDAERRLHHDVDVWVASASKDGLPYLVPLSFDWDGEALLLATAAESPTGRNLTATRTVRLGLGVTRDVVMIEGEVQILDINDLPSQDGDRFATRTGFDPRTSTQLYRWFRVRPRRIQAWREENELAGRELMKDGRWLV